METMLYFLDFLEIKDELRKMQKPVVDLLMLGQVVQSESPKAFICTCESAAKKGPSKGLDFMYLRICCTSR